jgi:putative membrane-bound dehydrogenase-like protein
MSPGTTLRPLASAFTAVAAAVLLAAPAGASPVAPEQGPASLAVPEGLEATLFAAEPLLTGPADIDVDARGRVWVVDVLNYRSRTRARAEGDMILVLEDVDGDGRAEKRTVFHQGHDLDGAMGICVLGEGPGRRVIVSCAPEVFVLHDDDGDLVADRREPLFTNSGKPQHDHSLHAFVVGPDGRWYFNVGNTGGTLHDRDGKPVTDRFGIPVTDKGRPYRQGMVFRCRPDGSDFEVLAHNFRNPYEVAVDSFGGLWQSDNDDDGNRSTRLAFVMEHGNFGYVDERTGAGWQVPRTNLEADVPARHWHQNDPGVVPNLAFTGAGAPTGVCVYEGTVLPERFHGAMLACDAGPNLVRACRAIPQGAGYRSELEALVDGKADGWFRPSDVCVAPDGSLLVADWYDPIVGGHGSGDAERGRVYRVAPRGAAWRVPALDLATPAGAVQALASPNLCTRAMALERLAAEPEQAHAALAAAFAGEAAPVVRARLAWAAGMLPGRGAAWTDRLAADADPALRIVALRLCRRAGGDVVPLVARLANDPSAAVRREAAIALYGVAGTTADRAWAQLADRHEAGDRWNVEALGIGGSSPTDASLWDGRLAAWRERVGDRWRSPTGREIVWRSRATATPRLLCDLIADPSIDAAAALPFVRALDFQDAAAVSAEIRGLLGRIDADTAKRAALLPEVVLRLDPATVDAADAPRIAEAAGLSGPTPRFVEIVKRFALADKVPDLLRLAGAESTPLQLAVTAVQAAVALGGDEPLRVAVAGGGPDAARILDAAGAIGSPACVDLAAESACAAEVPAVQRTAAVRALVRSQAGAIRLVALARDGKLGDVEARTAAVAVAACGWVDVRKAAVGVLPLPTSKGGPPLPPIAELVRRSGDVSRGQAVFRGAGTCAKCHVVGDHGGAVGPSLSGIGAKLTPVALYESILAPSAAISHNYETFTAVTADGRSVTGLLVSQSPAETILRGADGLDVTLPTAEIEELVRQPLSLMPADLAASLEADELVDLVAYLQSLRGGG